MTYENFNTYDESDDNGRYVKTTNKITFTNAENTDDNHYIAKNMGVGFFEGDFDHKVDVNLQSSDNGLVTGSLWGLADEMNDIMYFLDNDKDAFFVEIAPLTATYWQLVLRHYAVVGGSFEPMSGLLEKGTTYYLRIKRTGITLNLSIYTSASDREAEINVFESLQLSTTTQAFSIIYGVNTHGYTTPTKKATGYIENLDLGLPEPEPSLGIRKRERPDSRAIKEETVEVMNRNRNRIDRWVEKQIKKNV